MFKLFIYSDFVNDVMRHEYNQNATKNNVPHMWAINTG